MEVAKLCGILNGKEIAAFGKYIVMAFHTDRTVEERGFRLFYTVVQMGKCSGKAP